MQAQAGSADSQDPYASNIGFFGDPWGWFVENIWEPLVGMPCRRGDPGNICCQAPGATPQWLSPACIDPFKEICKSEDSNCCDGTSGSCYKD